MTAVQSLTDVDRTTLLRDFIDDGLRKRVLESYREGKISVQRAADILDISLREFLSLLEKNGFPINWNSDSVHDYMTSHYGD